MNDIATPMARIKSTRTVLPLLERPAAMGRYDSRIAKMIDLSTSLAAFRHRALLIAESIIVGADQTKRKQDRLDRLQSIIEGLEIALEEERRSESLKAIASQRLEEAPLAPPVLWA